MKPNLFYPNSFRRLLAVGFLLVVLPLALGLIGNAISIRQLKTKSQEAVYSATRMMQASWGLLENIRNQERVVLQYQVLRDPHLFQAYDDLHAKFGVAAAQLSAMVLTREQRTELDNIVARESALHAVLSGEPSAPEPGREASPATIDAQFDRLVQAAEDLFRHNRKVIDSEVESLQDLAARAEQTMIFEMLALLLVVPFLVVGFTRLLTGPVAQLEAAIGGLWTGRFDRKIEVTGPTDLQQIGAQLDRLRLRLMQLEEKKSRFLRQVSHELKTPLAALREGSDLLAEETTGPLTAPQKEIVDILTDNSKRLRKLIEDLLAYSAADFEQSVLQRQVFPVRPLVEAVIDSQRLVLNARELSIDAQVEDIALDADRERVRTVLDNLLSNAAKFSPTVGTISLRIYREGTEAVIEIADQGPGVAEEDRDRIFDPFYQGRHTAAGPLKSSGLGLSIAQEHVLAHGGRLLLLPGDGARFQVRLPLQWGSVQ